MARNPGRICPAERVKLACKRQGTEIFTSREHPGFSARQRRDDMPPLADDIQCLRTNDIHASGVIRAKLGLRGFGFFIGFIEASCLTPWGVGSGLATAMKFIRQDE